MAIYLYNRMVLTKSGVIALIYCEHLNCLYLNTSSFHKLLSNRLCFAICDLNVLLFDKRQVNRCDTVIDLQPVYALFEILLFII